MFQREHCNTDHPKICQRLSDFNGLLVEKDAITPLLL